MLTDHNGINEELDIISQVRGKVMQKQKITGRNPFLVWGYSIVIFYLLTFAALMLWHSDWCLFILCGIPVVGVPFMENSLHEDYKRSHVRTKEDNYVLKIWLFIGVALGFAAFATGFAGLYHQCLFSLVCLFIGMGGVFTGVILQSKPKVVCGVIACLLSAVPLFLQGDLWPWQLFVTAIVTIIALVIPGHIYISYLTKHNQLES